MSRFRRKRSGGGGGGGSSGLMKTSGFLSTVMGAVAMLIALITFGIALSNYDTTYTAVSGYTWMTGLTSIMGPFPMVIFLAFMAAGVGAVGYGGFQNYKMASGGNFTGMFYGFIMAAVSVVIVLIMYGIIATQMNTTAVAINATTNIASFVGLISIVSVWSMVVFVVMVGAAIAPIAGIGVGAVRKFKGTGS